MAQIQTQGFRVNAMPQFTPVDPRYAVADPTAMFRGIQGGMGLLRDIEADALLRQDRPRQQILRDIELAQAQAALESAPGQKRLKDLQLAEAERRFRIGALEPIEQGKPIREIDASGNLIEYQPTLDFNPSTGLPYGPGEKPAIETSIIKTNEERESAMRANEALAYNRMLTGEAAATRAARPAGTGRYTIKEYPDERNQQIVRVTLDPQGNEVSRTVVLGPDNKPVPPKPTINPLTGKPVFEVTTRDVDGPESEIFGSSPGSLATGGTVVAPAKITGTQAPANAVPEIQLAMPFNSEAEAMQAAQLGLIVPGQRILINGRPAIWE